MIRTVWLAIICLMLISALAAGKALMTTADPTVATPPASADEPMVEFGQTQDTLSKSDRLEIAYVRQEIPSPPALRSIEPAAPVVIPATSPPIETKIISRHWRDPQAFPSSRKTLKPTKPTDLNKASQTVDRKRNQAADRSKLVEPVKPCSRLGPIGDLLRSVNLSSACAS